MVEIKSENELQFLREAGRIAALTMAALGAMIKPGITTEKLDAEGARLIKEMGGEPAFKGYRGFPANLCVSINEEVVHGIPSNRVLRGGDIVSIDIGVKFKDFFADAAETFAVGGISPEAKRLIDATKGALVKGIEAARASNRISDISWAIQSFVEANGFSIVRAFVGHGIGRNIHEPPEVPNFGKPGKGMKLVRGMVLAIEPMVNIGGASVEILSDGWTAVTKDGSLSAHVEHTVAIGEEGAEVLTKDVGSNYAERRSR